MVAIFLLWGSFLVFFVTWLARWGLHATCVMEVSVRLSCLVDCKSYPDGEHSYSETTERSISCIMVNALIGN
jgi:hypothetical protein